MNAPFIQLMSEKTCGGCGEYLPQLYFKRKNGKMNWGETHTKHCHKCNKWDKNTHPAEYKGFARGQMDKRPDLVRITYSCPHPDRRRVNHHNNYDYPFIVWLVCSKCHAKAHALLRKGANPLLFRSFDE